MNFINKASLAFLVAIFFGTALLSFSSSVQKPFTLDETDISIRSHHINLKGAETFKDGTHYIAHPPMYEYVVALLFRVFGESEFPVRAFGIVCFLISALFMLLTLRELFNKTSSWIRHFVLWTALVLLIGNPLMLQHSMLVDGDTTGTILFACMFLFLFVRYELKAEGVFITSRVLLALAFAGMILSKEITPILVAISLLSFRIVNRQAKRFVIDGVLVIVLGSTIAWGVWLLYCVYTGVDSMAFLNYTLFKKTPRALNGEHLFRAAKSIENILRWPVYWASTPFFVLLIFATCYRIARFFKSWKWHPVDYCWMMGYAIWLPYLFVKPTIDMMKYQYPIYPAFIIVMVYVMGMFLLDKENEVKNFFRTNHFVLPLTVVSIIGCSVYYFYIGDYLQWMWDRPYYERWQQFISQYYWPLAGILSLFGILYLLRRISFKIGLMYFSMIAILPINLGLSWNQTAPYTTAESWMNYGESGHHATADYLVQNLTPNSWVSMRKDIGYYVKEKGGIPIEKEMDLRQILVTQKHEMLAKLFQTRKLEFIVIDNLSMIGMTEKIMTPAMSMIGYFYDLDQEFGSFKIYRLKKL